MPKTLQDSDFNPPYFRSLREFAGLITRRQESVSADDLRGAYERAIPGTEVLSFDVFDTLIVRQVARPVDVFLFLERDPVFRPLFPSPNSSFVELRVKAEHLARQRLFRERGTGEATLSEIYAVFCELGKIPATIASRFVTAEEKLELLLVRPNASIQRLFETAKATGKRVIAVSDTYHHKEFVCRLLAHAGVALPEDDLFVSSDMRINKQSGKLWTYVIGICGTPGHILHLGDHPVSDYSAPRKLGIQALLHQNCVSNSEPCPAFHTRDAAATQSYIRAATAIESRCAAGSRGFWWRLGHNVFGPLLTGFCQWLEQGFAADHIDRAYFLLRDGEIFLKVYEVLFPEPSIKPQLLQSSRRAYVFPLLDSAPEFVLRNLFVGKGERPVGEFLARLGVVPSDFPEGFKAAGFQSSDQPIDGRFHTEKLRHLVKFEPIAKELRAAAHAEKLALVAYLRQKEVMNAGRVAIVDLGWNGTIQKALQLLLNQEDSKLDVLIGYYLASHSTFQKVMPVAKLETRSFLLQFGEPKSVAEVFQPNGIVVETVCSSTVGSLLRFKQAEGSPTAILLPNVHDDAHRTCLSEVHDGIVGFAKSFRESQNRLALQKIPAQVAAESLLRLMASPTKEEAQLLGKLSQCDDFGSTNTQFLARFRETSRTPAEVWEDYQRASWKSGMMNQVSLQCAMLRTLLWLIQP